MSLHRATHTGPLNTSGLANPGRRAKSLNGVSRLCELDGARHADWSQPGYGKIPAMRTRGWQGDPPLTDDEARARILDAAKRCVERFGPSKTRLADVANELGVT